MIKYPKPLKKGDTIGICAPSSGVTGVFSKKLDNAIKKIKKMDYKIIETNSVRMQNKLVSASKETRAQEFTDLYLNENVKAVIPPWGGEFLMDILPFLNLKKLAKAKPKWVMGFSDMSTLLFVLTLTLKIATVHGPNFLDFGNDPIDESVLKSLDLLKTKKGESFYQESLKLYQKEWLEVAENNFPPYNLTEKVNWKLINKEKEVKIKGRFLGGNLDVICKLIGTQFDKVNEFIDYFKKDGFIWYFESCEMDSSDIHRTLWQMEKNGWFKNCSGMLYGRVEGYNDVQDYTYIDALDDLAKTLNIPIIYDVDLGHKPPQLTFVNGAFSEVVFTSDDKSILQKFI